MNRYHLDLIVSGTYGVLTHLITIEADGFDHGQSGAYRFWNRVVEDNDIVSNKVETVAMYPINRTIIRKIEKDINK